MSRRNLFQPSLGKAARRAISRGYKGERPAELAPAPSRRKRQAGKGKRLVTSIVLGGAPGMGKRNKR